MYEKKRETTRSYEEGKKERLERQETHN